MEDGSEERQVKRTLVCLGNLCSKIVLANYVIDGSRLGTCVCYQHNLWKGPKVKALQIAMHMSLSPGQSPGHEASLFSCAPYCHLWWLGEINPVCTASLGKNTGSLHMVSHLLDSAL